MPREIKIIVAFGSGSGFRAVAVKMVEQTVEDDRCLMD